MASLLNLPLWIGMSVAAAASAVAAPVPQAAPHHKLAVIRLTDATTVDAARLCGVALDCQARLPDDQAEIVVTADQEQRMLLLGARMAIAIQDLESYYAERLKARRALPPTGIDWAGGSMGGYFTLAEMEALLDGFSAAYPAICTAKFSIGQSIEGRDLWAIKVSDNPATDEDEPEVRFDSLHHAREPVSMHMSLYFLDWLLENYGTDPLATHLVDEREIWFIPAVNPDGYEYNRSIAPGGGGMWRKNRRDNGGGSFGVDLNRNYSYQWGFDDGGSSGNVNDETYRGTAPTSEPETAAMEAFIAGRTFRTSISAHTYSDLWLFPWGYTCSDPPQRAEFDLIAQQYTEENGYVHGTICQELYSANGDTVDYDFGVHATWSATVEIGGSSDGFWPSPSRIVPLLQENLHGYQRIALYAAAGIEADGWTWVESSGDGDAWYEPGEEFDLGQLLTNCGTLPTGGSATLTVTSSDPDVQVVNGALDLGTVAAFASVDTHGTPLRVHVAANATPGRHVDVRTDLAYDGWVESHVWKLIVGAPSSLDLDDLETNLGWIAGAAGDTAVTGRFEISDPQQTTSGGQTAQPADDHSASGSLCAVTDGRAGTGAGTYDLDSGYTTLISPQFDLEDANSPLVSYWRWFTDLTVADDEFDVDVSNDDGATWIPVESVQGNANSWQKALFDPAALVPLTDRMRLRWRAFDDPNNSVVEALVDDLEFQAFTSGRLELWRYGTPTPGGTLRLHLQGDANRSFVLFLSLGGGHLDTKLGLFELDFATLTTVAIADTGASGRFTLSGALPNDPALVGLEVDLQALVFDPGGAYLSNAVDFEVE